MLEHSTVDNAGCGKLKAQKSCSCGKPHVCKRRVQEQVKVKNSREL